MPKLLRRLGSRDAALIVMGGIVGSGIFMNPSVVAKFARTPAAILGVWIAGGAIALLGAGLFAELGARRPADGGLYAYLRDAFHPAVAFAYGWTLLFVGGSGGIAAAAVTFATYAAVLGLGASKPVAVAAIALFTAINALGVRAGAGTQNAFMVLKIVAIAAFVAIGLFAPAAPAAAPLPGSAGTLGLALVPVLYAYLGWQTASFMSGELRDPQVTLPRGMLLGVGSVVVLYLAVNAVCVRVLGAPGLAQTSAPASAVVAAALGPLGARGMAIVVALSTLGFLSNQILSQPRIYYQMAADRTFFPWLAHVDPRTHAPTAAILVQGVVAVVITLSGRYDQILNYVTSTDFAFFGLCAIALILFRARDARAGAPRPYFTLPGHPWTTVLFLVVSWAVVGDVLIKAPVDTAIGLGILLTGLPAYAIFARTLKPPAEAS